MNVAILGASQPSQIVAQIIEQNYNLWLEQRLGEKLNVAAYIGGGAAAVGNIPVLSFAQFVLLYHKKVIDKIILPREVYTYYNVGIQLVKFAIKLEDVYMTSRLNENISVDNFLTPYLHAKYLPYLEYHIADHCNLNCLACGHCSSLVKEPTFPDLKKFTRDFEQFHKFINDFGIICIMGGEPLLNPEINEYVKLTRRLYPFAEIRIVTNALLLPQMPEDFFDTLRNCDIRLHISVYPPVKSKIPAIRELVRSKGINMEILTIPKDEFSRFVLLHPHANLNEKFYSGCTAATCNFIYDGKVAVCCMPFTAKYFNEYFHENLPTDGVLDLYDESMTSEKIVRHMLKPIKACGHCGTKKLFKWRPVSYPVKLSDWVLDYSAAD